VQVLCPMNRGGLTRGKRLVVVVGQAKAVAMAARSGAAGRRWSKLREHLAATGDAPVTARADDGP
jgi:hypothetical protein